MISKEEVSFDESETVTKKIIDQDWQLEDIDEIAKETFNELMRIWLDRTNLNERIDRRTSLEGVDFVVDLPSMQPEMPPIQTFWIVKSALQKLERHLDSELQSWCFYITFSTKTINILREISQQYKHIYLAFAHNSINANSTELYQCTPQERFEWYCIDLSQQFSCENYKDYIVIPDGNKFNLSTFSLLWSSLWVEKFYNPLYSSKLIDMPNLLDIIRLTHPYKNECVFELEDWSSLKHKLSICEKELGKNGYSEIAFPLGVGYSLEVIKKKLYETSSNLTTIQNYCPESLYGTANLWLFSRPYHNFMTTSGQVVALDKQNSNLRILPLPDNPQNISGLVKVCLWHIVLLYSSLNVEVRIIYRPSFDAGVDHSYYGGGIGYFPWLSLSDDGVTWMMEENIDATNSYHRDFINEQMDNLFIDPDHSNLWEIANTFDLNVNDLCTAQICPIQLFPKEGRFIEYPYFIFGNYALRSLNSIKLKLS